MCRASGESSSVAASDRERERERERERDALRRDGEHTIRFVDTKFVIENWLQLVMVFRHVLVFRSRTTSILTNNKKDELKIN